MKNSLDMGQYAKEWKYEKEVKCGSWNRMHKISM